jgi:hypothetical protein
MLTIAMFISLNRCLKRGLSNPNKALLTKDDEAEYTLYNKTREHFYTTCHAQCEKAKFSMRPASFEEVKHTFSTRKTLFGFYCYA